MPASTRTGQQVLDALGELIGDSWSSTTTAAGGSGGGTLTDSELQKFGTDALRGYFVRITSGAADNETARIDSNTGSSLTVRDEFTAQIASGVTYEIHKYDPAEKWLAIDRARIRAFPTLSLTVYDETLFGDDERTEWPLPVTLRSGPYRVWIESPLDPDADWNVLGTPRFNALADWTASAGTAALYSENTYDRTIPKFETTITKLSIPDSTGVTYQQTVGSMTISAADAAGRDMEFGVWIYCTTASRVTIDVVDDTASATSSAAHQGRGWEFLRVEHTVDGDNATTLTVGITVSSGDPLTIFLEGAWFTFGDIPDFYHERLPHPMPRRDASVQSLRLPAPVPGGYNMRIEGRDLLSAIGGDDTATIELDEESEELFVAMAASVLFDTIGIATDDLPTVAQKIARALAAYEDMDELFDADLYEEAPVVEGPWW